MEALPLPHAHAQLMVHEESLWERRCLHEPHGHLPRGLLSNALRDPRALGTPCIALRDPRALGTPCTGIQECCIRSKRKPSKAEQSSAPSWKGNPIHRHLSARPHAFPAPPPLHQLMPGSASRGFYPAVIRPENYTFLGKTTGTTWKKPKKTPKTASAAALAARRNAFFRRTASALPDPTRTHAVGFILSLFSWLILFYASMYMRGKTTRKLQKKCSFGYNNQG